MWNASIVVFHPNITALKSVLQSAADTPGLAQGIVIDNSSDAAAAALVTRFPQFRYLRNPDGNTGFGRAHNLAFRSLSVAPWHAILNPDIRFASDAIPTLIRTAEANPRTVLAVPAQFYPNGERQYLCKRYPTIRALFARRFLSARWAQKLGFTADAAWFEMRDANYDTMLEPKFLSGCFMLFRHDTFEQLRGFDEQFFMYFEDTDITLRARHLGRAIHVPDVHITHEWARGSHRSWRLTWATIVSAFKLFNKHGWRWRDPDLRHKTRQTDCRH